MLPLLLALACAAADPGAAGPPEPAVTTETYTPPPDVAALLADPERWCDGAARLTALGDPRGIDALLHAYRSRSEADKLCLLDAMDALGGEAYAAQLAADPARAADALALMALLPSDAHLPALVAGCASADAGVRGLALRSLSTQKWTPAWEAAQASLLSSPYADVRGAAIDALARRNTDTARAELAAALPAEADPALRARIDAALP